MGQLNLITFLPDTHLLLILLHIVLDLTLGEGSSERDYNIMYFV